VEELHVRPRTPAVDHDAALVPPVILADPSPGELAQSFAAARPNTGRCDLCGAGRSWNASGCTGSSSGSPRAHLQPDRANLAPSGALYGSDADDPPFFSEEWWAVFRDVLKRAEQLGIRIWFYDQIGFSGASLQAKLVTQHPEFRAQTLQVHELNAEQPARWSGRCRPRRGSGRTDDDPAAKVAGARRAAVDLDAGQETATGKVFFRRSFELPAAREWQRRR